MNILKTAITSFVPGGALLGAFLTSAGATNSEQKAVEGLYDHLKQSQIGPLLPESLDMAVKLLMAGKALDPQLAPVVARALASPIASSMLSGVLDKTLSAYEFHNDIISVMEKLAEKGAIPKSTENQTAGEYLVALLKKLQPTQGSDHDDLNLINIPHICPNCRFAHIVRAGAIS